jgi:hypothetical protein
MISSVSCYNLEEYCALYSIADRNNQLTVLPTKNTCAAATRTHRVEMTFVDDELENDTEDLLLLAFSSIESHP